MRDPLIKIGVVMAPNTGRQFKQIFEEAQQRLRDEFGMELTELPQREKVTVAQKRCWFDSLLLHIVDLTTWDP